MHIKEYLEYYEHIWKKRWREIPLLADPELIRRIGNTFDVVYLTNRSNGTRMPLLNYCEFHGIDTIPVVSKEFSNDKSQNGFDIYIDDYPDLAAQIEQSAGKFLYLPKRPYNTEVKNSDKVKLVDNVNEALQDLLSRAKR